MLALDDALTQMLSKLPSPSQKETIALTFADNRILAKEIISPINVPSFDNSAMDGYAVRLADLKENLTLPLAGKSFAGKPFEGVWQKGTVIRIMTGAPVPEGTDAVVMQEKTTEKNGLISFSEVPRLGENIRYCGEEIKKGDVVLNPGIKLNTRSLPLIASLGLAEVSVYKKVKVALLSTGDELQEVGKSLQNGQIYDLNRFTLKLCLQKLGCEVLDYGILPDDESLFEKTFLAVEKEADLVITSGGVSVGEADFTKTVLEKIGEMNFWKIAMKPGKPFAFGKLPHAWFCGLPGNPVSALVTFYQLVQPAIAKLSGHTAWQLPSNLPALAACNIKKRPGRLDFQRGVYFVNEEGKLCVQPVGFQGSHLFSALVQSNCFIVLDAERGNVDAGEMVQIQPFNEILA